MQPLAVLTKPPHRLTRDIFRVTERRVTARLGVSTPSATLSPRTIRVVRARAVAGIRSDGLLDQVLPDLIV